MAMTNTRTIRTPVQLVTVCFITFISPQCLPCFVKLFRVSVITARFSPSPIPDFGHVLAVGVNVLLMLDELILDHPHKLSAIIA